MAKDHKKSSGQMSVEREVERTKNAVLHLDQVGLYLKKSILLAGASIKTT